MHNINFGVAGRIICSDVFGHDQKERRVTTMACKGKGSKKGKGK